MQKERKTERKKEVMTIKEKKSEKVCNRKKVRKK